MKRTLFSSKIIILCLIICSPGIFIACGGKNNTITKAPIDPTPVPPGPNPVNPGEGFPPAPQDPHARPTVNSCISPGVGDAPSDYYRFQPIIAMGKNSASVVWSSALLPSSIQQRFVTDGRLRVRLLAKPGPSATTKTVFNEICEKFPVAYTKLQVRVGVKAFNGSGYLDQQVADYLPVGGCSPTIDLQIPQNSSATPFVIELMDMRWDYSCIWENQNSTTNKNDPQYCPWHAVWAKYCVEMELQMATSYTKNIP